MGEFTPQFSRAVGRALVCIGSPVSAFGILELRRALAFELWRADPHGSDILALSLVHFGVIGGGFPTVSRGRCGSRIGGHVLAFREFPVFAIIDF